MNIPTNIPETGFYYHYKHDPQGPVNGYAYELVGVGVHTEADCRPQDAAMVAYRPLYKSDVYDAGKLMYLRPLDMWNETVTKGEKTFKRFQKISDPTIIVQLETIKAEMYGKV